MKELSSPLSTFERPPPPEKLKFLHTCTFKAHHCSFKTTQYSSRRQALYISTYINTKMFVCVSVCSPFSRPCGIRLGYPLAQRCFIRPRMGSKIIIFQKKIFSRMSYCPFSIFLEDFSVNLKSNYAKTNGDRNEILFAHN